MEITQPLIDPAAVSEIGQIASTVPSGEMITSSVVNIREEKSNLINEQEATKNAAAEADLRIQSAGNEIVQNEQRLAELEGMKPEVQAAAEALRVETNNLASEIVGKQSQLEMIEAQLGNVDEGINQRIIQLNRELRQKTAEVNKKFRDDSNAISDEVSDEYNRLYTMLKDNEKDALAGERVTADGTILGPKPIEDLKQIFGEDSEEVKKAQQVAEGGAMAADLTNAELSKIEESVEQKRTAALEAADAEKARLKEETAQKIEAMKAEGEEMRAALMANKTQLSDEIDTLSATHREKVDQWMDKEKQLDNIKEVQEKIAGKVEGLSAEIENFKAVVTTSNERMMEIVEQIGAVKEKEVTAIEALKETQEIIKTRRESVLISSELALVNVNQAINEKLTQIYFEYKTAEQNAVDNLALKTTAIENALLQNADLFARNPEGKIVTVAAGLDDVLRAGATGALMQEERNEAVTRHNEEIEAAYEKNLTENDETFLAGEEARHAIEEQRLAALAKLDQAFEAARFLIDTMEISPLAPTPENATKQTSLLNGAKNFMRSIFGKK